MAPYLPTSADRAPLPPPYGSEARYLGYRESDLQRPFARFFTPTTAPIQEHVRDALIEGKVPAELGYGFRDAARQLERSGYGPLETGWTRTADGTLMIACLTDMPGVTAGMWDWWFGWHSTDSARYKLWNPEAHQFTAIGEDRSADRSLTDRQRYVGNVSYVDEYIGGALMRLAIRFVDPASLGFDDRPETTVVCARTGFSALPVATGWLVHQVRPTATGAEMRSRFFIGDVTIMDLPAHALPAGRAAGALRSAPVRAAANRILPSCAPRFVPRALGHDLLFHCAAEMNHLARFLPELHAAFRDLP